MKYLLSKEEWKEYQDLKNNLEEVKEKTRNEVINMGAPALARFVTGLLIAASIMSILCGAIGYLLGAFL